MSDPLDKEILEFIKLRQVERASAGRAWGVVFRTLSPALARISDDGEPDFYLSPHHRWMAARLAQNADAIDALPPDEIVAVFEAGGRPALYELCVAGGLGPTDRGVVASLARLDRAEKGLVDGIYALGQALAGVARTFRQVAQSLNALRDTFKIAP
jgi:hypothetical protein